MRKSILIILCFLPFSSLHAQTGCDVSQFKALTIISEENSISDTELETAVRLLKKLEHDKCSDYVTKNGTVIADRTHLFGEICLKKNDKKSVYEYVDYLKRQRGSAEEELSFVFERLFQRQPKTVLLEVGDDKYLLDHLTWGFLNNHYYSPKDSERIKKKSGSVAQQLNRNNYKKIFFEQNPQIKELYPGHKKQIDYLLHSIYLELNA